MYSKKQTLNYSSLLLNYCAERESVWHHTPFLLFTTVALCDTETCKYPLARFMYYPIRLHCDVTGEHKLLYALCADSTFIARLNAADCDISRYAAAMSSALLFPAVWIIRLFRSLQVKFNYIAAKLARKGKKIYAYRIWASETWRKGPLGRRRRRWENNITMVKGKAVPLQAWSGPEGSRKLRFPDFVTTTRDGGRLSALRTGRLYPPGNTSGTNFC